VTVAVCLERSRELPLAVQWDLQYGRYFNCTCVRGEWSFGMRTGEDNPCHHHTTINTLQNNHVKRIHTLVVHLTWFDDVAEEDQDQDYMHQQFYKNADRALC